MLLIESDGTPFSSGCCDYICARVTPGESTDRLFLPIQVAGLPTMAVLDTGAAFLVIDPNLLDNIGDSIGERIMRYRLFVRGYEVRGALHRVNLRLHATTGEALEEEV